MQCLNSDTVVKNSYRYGELIHVLKHICKIDTISVVVIILMVQMEEKEPAIRPSLVSAVLQI